MIFYDVQVQEFMNGLGMAGNDALILAVNRLKSLQKLYLFEQKGGENYLGWTLWESLNDSFWDEIGVIFWR